MSKPNIADAILRSRENNENNETTISRNLSHIYKLNTYLKTISIEKYPPIIQQAIRDIRYISETQREAQNDDLVCLNKKTKIKF